jgi:hypothetical protein
MSHKSFTMALHVFFKLVKALFKALNSLCIGLLCHYRTFFISIIIPKV